MSSQYRVGDWVEVRSLPEILRTLDANGQLAGLPFMPEMIQYCGQRFQVFKSAHKTCDTVCPTRGRRMAGAVHLATRCDGRAHGGCQAECLLFWKDEWVTKVDRPAPANGAAEAGPPAGSPPASPGAGGIWAATLQPVQQPNQPTYMCQATQLPHYTSPLRWWHFTQYLQDYASGN